MKKINIGIVAHVDAGKTTVTEHLLYNSGTIKEIGRVDSGNTQTDSMELERKRGISIKASTTSFFWEGVKINVIDTPGHVDFVAEVERSLGVLDGAILVVSAKEGIQSQTRVLFDTLKNLQIPTIIFINKVDRLGSDYKRVIREIKNSLSHKAIALQEVVGEGSKQVELGQLFDQSIIPDLLEILAEEDNSILEAYIKGENISKAYIMERVCHYSQNSKLYPVLCGSALRGLGIENLLNAIPRYLPLSDGKENEPLSGTVFKIERKDNNEKKVYLRVFAGRVSLRDTISISNKGMIEKVTKINLIKDGKQVEARTIGSGDIGVIYGLNKVRIGDVIGVPSPKMKSISMAKPILKAKISPMDEKEQTKLFKTLTLLAEEDPLLQIETEDMDKEIYINLFGDIQMEIIKSVLEDIYGIQVKFSDAMTIYKETAKGIGTSTMLMWQGMNPFAATVGLKIEPIERGLGLVYVSEVSTGSLPKSFQNAIEEAVFKTARQGLLGWEVTDTQVTLVHGVYNSVDSTPSDFRDLTPMVFMEALYKAQTELLEPLYKFELRVPKEVGGRALSDLQKMRATLDNHQIIGEQFCIQGLVPIDSSKHYKNKIASYTEGRGIFYTKFHGYQRDVLGIAKPRTKTMVDALNKKEYLLYKSNAIRL